MADAVTSQRAADPNPAAPNGDRPCRAGGVPLRRGGLRQRLRGQAVPRRDDLHDRQEHGGRAAARGRVRLRLTFVAGSRRTAALRRGWFALAAIAVVGGSIPFVLFFEGLARASSVDAAFLQKTLVVWVALLAVPLLGERVGPWHIAAIGLLVAGLALLTHDLTVLRPSVGELMVLAATLLWAVEIMIAKRLLSDLPSLTVAMARMAGGVVVLLLWAGVRGRFGSLAGHGLAGWMWAIATGVLLAAYVATWYAALARAPAIDVTAMLVPAAIVTAVLERVTRCRAPRTGWPRADRRRRGHRRGRRLASTRCRPRCGRRMTPAAVAETATVDSGPLLFARFAYPPNELGYCGPDAAGELLDHVDATVVDPDLRAWPRGSTAPGPTSSSSPTPTAWPTRSTVAWSRRTGWAVRYSTGCRFPPSAPRWKGGSARCSVPTGIGWTPSSSTDRARTMTSTCSAFTPGSGCCALVPPITHCTSWTGAESAGVASSLSTAPLRSCGSGLSPGMVGPSTSAPLASSGSTCPPADERSPARWNPAIWSPATGAGSATGSRRDRPGHCGRRRRPSSTS